MSNIDSDFRNKARAVGRVIYGGRPQSPGFYNPDGSTASMDSRQIRAERVVGAGRVGVEPSPIRLGPGEIMPERAGRASAPNFTLRGSAPAGQSLVPTYGFDPAMKGATSRLPEPPQPAPAQPGLAQRAGRAVSEGLGKVKGVGLGGALGAAGVAAQGLAMDHDGVRSQFYDDPAVSGFDKIRQGTRDVKTLALPAAAGVVGGVAGSAAGPAGTVAGASCAQRRRNSPPSAFPARHHKRRWRWLRPPWRRAIARRR